MKWIYSLLISLFVLGAVWSIWNDLREWQGSFKDNSVIIASLSRDDNASSSTEVKLTPLNSELEKKVITIIDRPFTPGISLSSEEKLDLEKKINDVYSSIKVNYDSLNDWIYLGQLRKAIGDYVGARDAWEFASLVRPKNSLSFHNLGDLYGFYLKDSSKSELNYLQSIRNDPMNVDAYLNLTDLYWYSGGEEGKKAIPEFLLNAIKNNANSEGKLPLIGRLAKYYEEIKDILNVIK